MRAKPFLTLAATYGLLIVYGSLFPLDRWQNAEVPLLDFLRPEFGQRLIFTDLVLNVLVYMPLGLLLVMGLRRFLGILNALLVAVLMGGALSFTLEVLQNYIPVRVSSLSDLLTNLIGTVLGGMLAAILQPDMPLGRWLWEWRRYWFRPDVLSSLGLIAFGLWSLSQLSPLAPSLGVGNLYHGLTPLLQTLAGQMPFDALAALRYILNLTGLGLLVTAISRPGVPVLRVFLASAFIVLLLKVPVVSRQLSLEALVGLASVALLLPLLRTLPPRHRTVMAAIAILGGFILSALLAVDDPEALPRSFNWIPFQGYLPNIKGLAGILENLWPFFALAILVKLATPPRLVRPSLWLGGGLVAALTFSLEWHQQFQPGRYPDITDVLLPLAAWTIAGWFATRDPADASPPTFAETDTRGGTGMWRSGLPATILGIAILGTILIVAVRLPTPNIQHGRTDAPWLPAPEALPAIALPDFRIVHPRLPAPTPPEIRRLETENPRWLRQHRSRARGGQGAPDSVILIAYIEPGSQDLHPLYERLLATKMSWRGHQQAKPLALAYDWLYDQWTETQREALRDKLVEAGDYLIHRIREQDRLSAYNVYLYNSPFQALMAVSLALYQDDPRGEPIMRFTHDLWKNRVLPVWRQIMGEQGGWHEGGEYVGIGIGQAVYQVPALWRAATGEDLFRTEPGLRGFLDFLVYRTRPDGKHFRWGDAGFFNREVPDRLPLAIEYGHAAAYSLNPPKHLVPTAWPWGPSSDDALDDSTASARLPWAKLFDGLGLTVARSDWTPNATYVTFKVGDNYWSHSHLDQGAFTVYRGGALAIDSGLYGPGYGTDHHMNYTYQTIAHNTLTVTDPEDTAPAPPRRKGDPPRPIANDGGQRRIGSGWGLGPAPVDLAEWQANREIYHTGKIVKATIRDDLLVMVADVTPAYTNLYSGPGEFSHRTRRVERFWRTFIYDRTDDAIIVFDQVTATRADFLKRWLLHSQNVPRITGNRFELEVPAQDRQGRQGGRLTGYVLLPRNAYVQTIGGPGFEFFVDGRNYDEGSVVAEHLARKPDAEPGAWRIEVIPVNDALAHQFLVVLLPTDQGTPPSHQVQLFEADGRIGVDISGPQRTTRWRFEPGTLNGQVQILPDALSVGSEERLTW
ncbi:MAG: DUF4962 domain-containing protein [Candidatus Competibacteraceae bacterium]|nr:MAG: DUF4962 domain-containing protein [Candidatus Competibacteraceae bacterium]